MVNEHDQRKRCKEYADEKPPIGGDFEHIEKIKCKKCDSETFLVTYCCAVCHHKWNEAKLRDA